MKKFELSKKDLIVLICFFLLGILIFFFGYYFYANSIMPIKEYVYDWSLDAGTNGILENNIFFGVILLLFIISIIVVCFNKCKPENIGVLNTENLIIYFLLIVNILAVLYTGKVTFELSILLLGGVLFKYIYKKYTIELLLEFVIYSVFITFIVYQFVETKVNVVLVMLTTLFFHIILRTLIEEKLVDKLFKIFQSVYPIVVFIYIKDWYRYREQIGTVRSTIGVWVFFVILVLFLCYFSVRDIRKYWKKEGFYISLVTCMVTSLIFSYSIVARYVYDSHHLAEEVISFNQMIIYHKIPYVNMFSVSGAFPIAIGFIENILGLGLAGTNMAVAIFNIMICIVVVYLLSEYIDNKYILLLTMLFSLANAYVRPNLIIIYILLLFLPALKDRSGYWLEAFILSSYVVVFFYPVFGIACIFSILPLLFINLYRFMLKKEYLIYIKQKKFILIALVEFVLVILLIPSTIGVVKHVLIYSDRSILTNVWATFGQNIPDIFLPYLKEISSIAFLRFALWYSIRYMLPIMFIVCSFYLFLRYIKENKKYGFINIYLGAGKWYFSVIIILLFVCTLTIKRQDEYSLLTRTGHILYPSIAIVSFLIFNKYFKKNIVSISILALIYSLYLANMDMNIVPLRGAFTKVQEIQDDYIYVSEEDSKKFYNFGEGFGINYLIGNLQKIEESTKDILKHDKDVTFFGLDLAYYEGLGLRAWEQPSISAIMTYKVSKHEIEKIEKQGKVVIYDDYILPTKNHYIYKYLLTTPNYVYSSSHHAFIPKTLANKMGIVGDDKKYSFWEVTDVGNNAATAGKSFDYLKPNYDDTNLEFTYTEPTSYSEIINNDTKEASNVSEINIDFNREITGLEGNYLYLDLQRDNGNISNLDSIEDKFMRHFTKEQINEKCTLNISWIGEEGRANFINCKMSDGRVFIPLEANTNWLLNSHKGIKVKVFGLDEGEKIHINSCEMMKSKDL